jgi:hypothetical protein
MQEYKIISNLRVMSLRASILVIGGVLFVVLNAWIFFLFLPQRNCIFKTQQELVLLSGQETKIKRDLLKFCTCVHDNSVRDQAYSIYVKKIKILDGIDTLVSFFEKNKLTCVSIKPVQEKTKKQEVFKQEYYGIQVKGTFCDFIQFFDDVKNNNCLIKFCTFTLTRWRRNKVICTALVRITHRL